MSSDSNEYQWTQDESKTCLSIAQHVSISTLENTATADLSIEYVFTNC